MADRKAKSTVPSKPTPSSADGPDLAKKFMRENPPGKLADPVEPRAESALSFPDEGTPRATFERENPAPATEPVVEDAAPAAPEATVDAQGIPIPTGGETPPVAEAIAAADGGEKPQAAEGAAPEAKPEDTPGGPIGAKATEEAKPQAAAPAAPSYAPDELIHLVPGSEPWSRQQIADRLSQSFTELEPKAREADQFHTLFGGNYADAEARWKPTLQKLAENPQRTAAMEKLLAVDNPALVEFVDRMATNPDPALLDYLQRSEQHFYSPDGGGFQRPAAAPTQQPAQLVDDPRIAHAVSVAHQMEGQLAVMRANNERAQVFMQYPVIQHNEKVRQALFARASDMYGQDEKAGKPLAERRGLLDAVKENQAFLEMAMIASRQAATPSPAIEPRPGVGAQALLPGTGPGALGTTRQAPPREYTGPRENAKQAFLEDYPA